MTFNCLLQKPFYVGANHKLRGVQMRVKAVLFDFFDTLLLIEGGDAFYMPSLRKLHEFLVNHGINVSFEDFTRVYFEIRDKLYAETEESLEEPHFNFRVSQTLQKLGYKVDASDAVVVGATEAFADEFMRYLHLDEDAIMVLQKMHEKYKLGVISNFAIPECIWKLLEKFSLKKFFDVVVISGAINKRKPSPEIFEKALKTIGVDASEAVFVGDTPRLDVKGAKAVGMRSILIQRETSVIDSPKSLIWKPREDDANLKPDKVIGSLSELLVALEDC
jgi:putative hydrolase of the HAD superfamily